MSADLSPKDELSRRLSVVVITKNEEKKLGDCLASVPFAGEMIVVDDYSTDATERVALEHGARFVQNRFENFSAQKNYAMSLARGDWILQLDADERVTSELAQSIQTVMGEPAAREGYFLMRENFIFGGPMRYGANGRDWQLRLVRRGRGQYRGVVHERIEVRGEPGRLTGVLRHYSYQTLKDYFAKFPLFTDLDAQKIFEQGKKPGFLSLGIKLPLDFIRFYIFKLGFLDGFRGLLYQLLASYYILIRHRKARALFRAARNG